MNDYKIVSLPKTGSGNRATKDELLKLRAFLVKNPGGWVEWPFPSSTSSISGMRARVRTSVTFGKGFEGRPYKGVGYIRYVGTE